MAVDWSKPVRFSPVWSAAGPIENAPETVTLYEYRPNRDDPTNATSWSGVNWWGERHHPGGVPVNGTWLYPTGRTIEVTPDE